MFYWRSMKVEFESGADTEKAVALSGQEVGEKEIKIVAETTAPTG